MRNCKFLALFLAGLFCLGGCQSRSGADAEQKIRAETQKFQSEMQKIIKDSGRASQACAVVDRLSSLYIEAYYRNFAFRKELQTLVSDMNSTMAEFEALRKKNQEERKIDRGNILDATIELANLTTDQEWKKLKKARQSVFNVYARSLEGRL